MTDFSQYQPPGIYINEEQTPLVSVAGVAASVVGIVGPGVGYRTATEPVTLNGTTAVPLTKRGIAVGSIEVRLADGTVVAQSGNYGTTVTGGDDASTSTTVDNVTTLARTGGSTVITDGMTVYATYRYTDAAYYAPARFNDFDDVKDAYGQPLDLATGTVTSPLALAAKACFENGARQVVLVPTVGTATSVTRADLATALSALDAVTDVSVVVVLPVGITGTDVAPGDTTGVGTDLGAAMAEAAANGIRRVGILGYDRTVTVDPTSLAQDISSKRVALVYPNRLNYYNGDTNTTVEVSGYYLAAALAGITVSQRVSEPLTKKKIRGFAGIPGTLLQTMSTAIKNGWSQSGVLVVEMNRRNDLVVRHGVSTDPTNIETRELSLTRQRDALVTAMQDSFEQSGLVGGIIEEDTPIRIKGVAAGVLETQVSIATIIGYKDLKVRRMPGADPSMMEVKFQYDPAYPLNYILISFGVNTTTGEITDQAA